MIRKRTILITTLLVILIAVSSSIAIASAESITMDKPFEPVVIEEGTIPLTSRDQSDPLEILCRLDKEKKYHIFLVGDWITNETSGATDYDIEVYYSNGNLISSHTESAGLPEQVANDETHQFFVPPKTDTYTFTIYNDPEDSEGEKGAVFMIIEHLEMNKRYELYLEGRPSPSEPYPEDYVWAYEFSTPSEHFELHVEVPDPDPGTGYPGLDMYEVRVFPMANPSAEVGYYIWELGVPEGKLLQGEMEGQYGLYNTSIPGEYFPDLRASCEFAGEDMEVMFGKPQHNETELVLETREVFYYMAMLAEYYHGYISFYIKTDYSPVNVTIIETPEIGVSGEEHLIIADVQGVGEIEDVWLNYTTDNWRTEERIQLAKFDGYYEGWLPRFEVKSRVQYRVYADDDIENSGMGEVEFTVLDPVNLHIQTDQVTVNGGEGIEISGEAPALRELQLRIQYLDNSETVDIKADENGEWSYLYTPQSEGNYNAKVFFDGDDKHPPAESREIGFEMEKHRPQIGYVVNPLPAKRNKGLEITGKLSPPISGVSVRLMYISQTSSHELETISQGDGSFSFVFMPDELGVWQVLPQVSETAFIEGTQGEIKSFDVIEMTPMEKVAMAVLPFTVFPLVVVPIVIMLGGLGLGEMRTGFIRGLLSRESEEEENVETKEVEDKRAGAKGATSYRRRSSRR